MNCYLLENYDSKVEFKNNNIKIALTPLASFQLDMAGVTYNDLNDYYDEKNFLNKENEFYQDQLKWFEKYDTFLWKYFPEAKEKNIKLASNYYFYLKIMIDSIIQRCITINSFIEKVKPDCIIYVSFNYDDDKLNISQFPTLFINCQSLFSRLFPLFCKKYNIKFERIIIKENDKLKKNNIETKKLIKNNIIKIKNIRIIKYLYYYYKILHLFKNNNYNKKMNLFFLKLSGNNVIDVIKDAQIADCKIYYKIDKKIFNNNNFIPENIENKLTNRIDRFNININELERDLLNEKDILGWVDDYCGINVSSIILPRLLYFIQDYCPKYLSFVNNYIDFYNKYNIDMVLTPHTVTADEFAAITATKYSIKTKSICLQHGDSAFSYKIWDNIEYSVYDCYLSSDHEMENYIKERIKKINISTKVYQYSYRLEKLPKNYKYRKNNNNKKEKKVLIYVPTIYPWDIKIWFESILPDTWYYRWQKELFDYLSKRNDFDIIWKGIPGSNQTYDPMPDLIKFRDSKNIKYAIEPFIKWIKKADLVLMDFPSTPLYEAAWSGLPVLSLYYEPYNKIRETAKKLFGNSLQSFGSFDEGIKKIDDYLNNKSDDFIVKIPYERSFFWEKY